jgi:hypothetical protein
MINALLEGKEIPILKCQELMLEDTEFDMSTIQEATPEGWEDTVKQMKKDKKISIIKLIIDEFG